MNKRPPHNGPSEQNGPSLNTSSHAPHAAHAPMPSSTPRMGPNLSPPMLPPLPASGWDEANESPATDASKPMEPAPAPPSDTHQDGTLPPGLNRAKRRKTKRNGRKTGKKDGKMRLKPKILANAKSFAMDKKPGPIVPKGTIAGHALVLVIAIMSFLAALTVAAVSIISDATRDWQADIGRGATIQIRRIEGVNIETELAKAASIAKNADGILEAKVLSANQSNALLEPWLGLDLSFDDLPVPRLIELTIDDPTRVDFAALSQALQGEVKGAILDNHRFWVARLRSMAETAILIGFTILFLVLSATILTVVFATRSAMSGNRETIEVLHFVGASNTFIAAEFQQKFFALGFKGSLAGGAAAIVIFLVLQLIIRQDEGSAALDQMQALLGVVQLGAMAYLGTLALVILIAVFTAITTRLTVMKTLSKLH